MAKTHTVIKGDLLIYISQKYYGTQAKWKTIVNANPQLKGRGTASDGSPLIFPGDNLIIPDDTTKTTPPKTIDAESENQVTIVIDGQKFAFFSDFTLTQEIDSFDTFRFSAPFDPEIENLKNAFRPFSYKSCDVFYGFEILFSGILLAPQSQSSPEINPVSISGYPTCGILNDVHLPITKYPMEFNNQDLEQITNNVIPEFGLSSEFSSSAGNRFKKVALEPTKNILSFLVDLALQRGLLISNNTSGNLLFWEADTRSITSNFTEGETPFISCVPNFNPQQFYSHITGIMNAKSGKQSEKYTIENDYLISQGIIRTYNFIIEDAEKSDLQTSVKNKAGRMFGDAMQYQLTVWGHRNKNNELYKKNTLISVLASRAMIYTDTQFLIKKVTFNRSSQGGDTTILDLVLPESYKGEIPTTFPFEG